MQPEKGASSGGGWPDVTRSTPNSPKNRSSSLRTAAELSRSVNFLLNVHDRQVDRESGFSLGTLARSEEMLSPSPPPSPPTSGCWNSGQRRQSSFEETPIGLLPPTDHLKPRRSSMSILFDAGHRHSHHSNATSLLTSVLSKTLRSKKYVRLSFLFLVLIHPGFSFRLRLEGNGAAGRFLTNSGGPAAGPSPTLKSFIRTVFADDGKLCGGCGCMTLTSREINGVSVFVID